MKNKFLVCLCILNLILNAINYYMGSSPSWVVLFCGWGMAFLGHFELMLEENKRG